MYKFIALGIGIVISIMVSLNGMLAGHIGNFQAIPIIHIAGLVAASFFLLFSREKEKKEKVPFYLYSAGIIGIALTFSNNICFSTIGISLTLSLGVLGQTIASLIADSTGFLGMRKYPFQKEKLLGLAVLLAGILVMVEKWNGEVLYIVLALAAGSLVILSMIINTQLSLRIGIFHCVQRNYIVGLIFSLALIPLLKISVAETFSSFKGVNPVFFIGGGVLGVFVIASSSKILPKIPIIYTSILIFLGQAGTGLLLDYFITGTFSFRKLIGAILVFLGLVINMFIDRRNMQFA